MIHMENGSYVRLLRRAATTEKGNLSLWQDEMGGKYVAGKRQAAWISDAVTNEMHNGHTF
jgi:hypothetical protein